MSRYFVTGTDTGVGKTEVACALLRALRAWRPFAFKPYESGMASLDAPGDSARLREAGGGWQGLETISLWRFRAALAPGIAARLEGRRPSWRRTLAAFRAFGPTRPGVVEGAGGLFVPLDARHDVVDLMVALRLPAVVVARAGLGTVNHTSLTLEALRRRRVPVAAVVLVQGAPGRDPSIRHNRQELERRYSWIRFLGPVRYEADPRRRARLFDRAVRSLCPRAERWVDAERRERG